LSIVSSQAPLKRLEDIAKPHGVIAGSAEGIFPSDDPRQGGVAAGD
jgi:hypothetical protein